MTEEFIFVELLILITFNLLIFFKTDSIVKTFISLFQMFSILLILVMIRIKISQNTLTTIYISTFIIMNLMLVSTILVLIRKSSMLKKTDRNFRPDEYDE